MHNKIKEVVLNVMTEWEASVKAKINMENDFFATLLAIEVYKAVQIKEAPAPRPARKPKDEVTPDAKEKPNTLSSLGLVAGANQAGNRN